MGTYKERLIAERKEMACKTTSESIAYADLPWAEKQQNTIEESKMQKLFPSKRLDEAMERLFEGANESGAVQYEEDFLKKEEE